MPHFPAAKLMDSVVGIDIHTAAARLQQSGLTALGARQVLQGQPVTLATDRDKVAKIVAAAVSNIQRT